MHSFSDDNERATTCFTVQQHVAARRITPLFAMIALGSAACGTDETAGPATTVAIETGESAPLFVAVRDGLDAPWQAIAVNGTSYTLEIHGAYVATVVCGLREGFWTYQFAMLPEDTAQLAAPCEASNNVRHVTGRVAQPGILAVDAQLTGAQTPDWTFDLLLPDGTYDFVALSEDRGLVRHGIAVAGDTALEPIDLAQGEALVPTPFTVTNPLPDETTIVGLGLYTASTSAEVLAVRKLEETKVLAPASLAAGDEQRITITSFEDGYGRTVVRPYVAGGSTAVTLPVNLEGARFEAIAAGFIARWATLPAFDELFVDIVQDQAPIGRRLQLSVGAAFAAGATEVTLDTAIPGFDPAWRVDPVSDHGRFLSAVTGSRRERTLSSFTELVAPLERTDERRLMSANPHVAHRRP
jgi:hypothetical protein